LKLLFGEEEALDHFHHRLLEGQVAFAPGI
jgi:hypothetical protein